MLKNKDNACLAIFSSEGIHTNDGIMRCVIFINEHIFKNEGILCLTIEIFWPIQKIMSLQGLPFLANSDNVRRNMDIQYFAIFIK
jgi:hypothetical protein